MLVTFRTCAAGPVFGVVQPGQQRDVPDELAKALIDGGYAQPVGLREQAGSPVRESAQLYGQEQAMVSPAEPKNRKKA